MKQDPHANLDAEQSVIGSMLIDPGCTDAVRSVLDTADFHRETHQWLFEVLCDLRDHQVDPDLLTVADELERRGRDPKQWEASFYCHSCIEMAITAANAAYHARIVRRCSVLRREAALGAELNARIQANDADPGSIQAWLSEQIAALGRDSHDGLVRIDRLLMGHWEQLAQRRDIEGIPGYTTGFSHLDSVTGGFGSNLFAVLKAPRGSGKTHHLVQLAVHCLRAGKAAAIFSLDTPQPVVINRFIAHLCGLNSFRLNLPRDGDWDAISAASNELWGWPLYVSDKSGTTIRDIVSQCKALASSGLELGLVGIDYAELVGPGESLSSREQELSRISIGLRQLCTELDTTVYLLSQVNKDGQERYSAAIGNNCDLLMSWHKERTDAIGRIVVEKNRLGATVAFDCDCDFETSRIRETRLDYSEPGYPPAWPWWYDVAADDFGENPNPYSLPGGR